MKNRSLDDDVQFQTLPDLHPMIEWFLNNSREFNWRESNEPYKVWVSEVMSQQTRAETVGAYFERFIERFPTIRSLADAPEADVLKVWEGLGYYSRARNLQKGARLILSNFGGSLPETAAELRKIPGIGSYTAGAIASFCFGEPEPAVDGNAVRIVARLLDMDWTQGDVKDREACYAILKNELESGRYTDSAVFNESFMNFGAMVCIPRAPRCEICPMADVCQAYDSGRAPLLPFKRTARPAPAENLTFVILETKDGKRLVSQRPPGLLGGLWEYPCLDGHFSEGELRQRLEEAGFTPARMTKLPGRRHLFSHRVWEMEVWHIELDKAVSDTISFGRRENQSGLLAAEGLAPYLTRDELHSPQWLSAEGLRELAFSAALAPYLPAQ